MNRHNNPGLTPEEEQSASEPMPAPINLELKWIDWQQSEPTGDSVLPDWLTELREMRGRVLYDEVLRPCFQISPGKFDDPDPADLMAYHVIARAEGRAVGCARIVPSKVIQSGFIARTIGGQQLEAIFEQLRMNPEQVCEASRWVVVPECRGVLGRRIVAASWAVARWLSFRTAFVLAATCHKQDLALIRMGARPIGGLSLFPSRTTNDHCRLLHFDVVHPSRRMEEQIADMAEALKLVFPPPVEVECENRDRTVASSGAGMVS
jgi:hypothetical protein